MGKAPNSSGGRLGELRAKAALFDELVEQLAAAEDELERVRRELVATRRAAARDGIDPAWREIANDLAGALRPYSLFREQRVEDGRIVVHTRVPGSTLRSAREALERLGRQVAIESYREHGIPVREDQQRAAERTASEPEAA
jgi:hypothetical protein